MISLMHYLEEINIEIHLYNVVKSSISLKIIFLHLAERNNNQDDIAAK